MPTLTDSQRANLRWIFRGPGGIRAGWSVLIFVAILAVPAVPLRIAVIHFHLMPKGEIPPALLFANEIGMLAVILAATAIMARIEKCSVWSYGLSGSRKLVHFLAGCLGGFAALSLVVTVLAVRGNLVFDGFALHGFPIVSYALIWLLGFILVGMAEETMFRGYLQATLARGIGFWPAAAVLSVLFAAGHVQNNGENAFGIAQVVAAGLALCLLLRVSGSLWMSIGFHAAWDWGQSYFYGTPDSGLLMRGHLLITHAAGDPRFSGGTAGPEGSALATPMLVVAPLVLAWICQRIGLFAPAASPPVLPAITPAIGKA